MFSADLTSIKTKRARYNNRALSLWADAVSPRYKYYLFGWGVIRR
jgi:hypothetical protein